MFGRGRKREAELQRLEEFRQLSRIAREDVTVLGEQLTELHTETLTDELDPSATRHYQQALDGYERAKELLRTAERAEDLVAADQQVVESRYQRACVLAVRDGEPLPARRGDCFFNPQHGTSRAEVSWTPPHGSARQIEVCHSCARRLAGGETPDQRLVRVGDRWVPWWQTGASDLASFRATEYATPSAHHHTSAAIAEASVRSTIGGAGGLGGGPLG